MKQIALINAPGEDAAFCPDKIDALEVDYVTLVEELQNTLAGWACLLAEGRGVAIVLKEEGDLSLFGISIEETDFDLEP